MNKPEGALPRVLETWAVSGLGHELELPLWQGLLEGCTGHIF